MQVCRRGKGEDWVVGFVRLDSKSQTGTIRRSLEQVQKSAAAGYRKLRDYHITEVSRLLPDSQAMQTAQFHSQTYNRTQGMLQNNASISRQQHRLTKRHLLAL